MNDYEEAMQQPIARCEDAAKTEEATKYIIGSMEMGRNIQQTWIRYFFDYSADSRVSQGEFRELWFDLTEMVPE